MDPRRTAQRTVADVEERIHSDHAELLGEDLTLNFFDVGQDIDQYPLLRLSHTWGDSHVELQVLSLGPDGEPRGYLARQVDARGIQVFLAVIDQALQLRDTGSTAEA